MRLPSAAFTLALACSIPPTVGTAQTAPWSEHYIVWAPHRDDPHPWRSDSHLIGRFTEPDYPDDVQVAFLNPDSARGGRHEAMWVTVIARDTATGRFLGILINPPDHLRNVQLGDNVVFEWNESTQFPVAILSHGGSYAAGWPLATSQSRPDSVLRDAVRAYRAGANGHNMPQIEECIRLLKSLRSTDLTTGSPEFSYVAYFTLGRCSAEKYATADAVAAFTSAVALAPDSLDSQMGLLAEYSVLANAPPAKLTIGSSAQWEAAFVNQLAEVRHRFAADTRTMQMLDWVLAAKAADDTTSMSAADLAKYHRIGFAVLRWKQR